MSAWCLKMTLLDLARGCNVCMKLPADVSYISHCCAQRPAPYFVRVSRFPAARPVVKEFRLQVHLAMLCLFKGAQMNSSLPTRSSVNRMLKYSPEHMHCLANIYGALAPPNTGVLAVQSTAANQRVNLSLGWIPKL